MARFGRLLLVCVYLGVVLQHVDSAPMLDFLFNPGAGCFWIFQKHPMPPPTPMMTPLPPQTMPPTLAPVDTTTPMITTTTEADDGGDGDDDDDDGA